MIQSEINYSSKSNNLQQSNALIEPKLLKINKNDQLMNKKKCKGGNWSIQQDRILLSFLLKNRWAFENEVRRRKNAVFSKLSSILKKRTPEQCRNHYQKLIKKHKGCIPDVIKGLKQKINNPPSLKVQLLKSQVLSKSSSCVTNQDEQRNHQKNTTKFVNHHKIDWHSVKFVQNNVQLNINPQFIQQW